MKLQNRKEIVEVENSVTRHPLVSISVVTYNHENYIQDCLDGILKQETDFKFEILLGEDDSTDQTRNICLEYAEKYPEKIRLFLHNRENVIYIDDKPTGRFNFIHNLSHSRGKYIALCEGDDYWTDPYKLQKQVDFLESNPEYAICFHPVHVLKDGEISADNLKKVPETTSIEDLATSNYIHTPSVIFRNNLFNEIPVSFSHVPAADYFLHLLNARHGKIKKLDDVMAVYRIHGGGIWSQKNQSQKNKLWIKQLYYINEEFYNDEISPLFSARLRNQVKQFESYEELKSVLEELEIDPYKFILLSSKTYIPKKKINLSETYSARELLKAIFAKTLKLPNRFKPNF